MKTLILSALAAAALSAGGAAFAQDGGAECQAGSAWGPKPGCGAGPSAPAQPYGNSGWPPPQQQPYVYGNSGWPPAQQPPEAHGRRGPHRNDRPAYPYVRPGDRDGDGIPNRRDRYPDDPYRY